MFYAYILKNRFDKIYIGYSVDLRKRIKSHNYGRVKSTKQGKPWKLVYYEAYLSKKDAKLREKTLKNYGSTLGQLKKRIAYSMKLVTSD